MTHFSIKDLSDFSGIKPHTIRIWEQRFTFLKPKRNETLRRLYNPEELNVLLEVSLLNQSGYKVSRIARMSDEEKFGLVESLDLSQQQQRHVHDLIISMAEMDSNRFEQVMDTCILYYGIHITLQKVIMPFCERVGLFQKMDNRNFIENVLLIKEIVKNKFHFGIEKARPDKKEDTLVLLFLPQGEHQELLLLYLQYLYKMEGLKTLYLGKQVTIENLERICLLMKPGYVVTQLMEKNVRNDLSRLVTKFNDILNPTKLITLGNPIPVRESDSYFPVKDAGQALELVQKFSAEKDIRKKLVQ